MERNAHNQSPYYPNVRLFLVLIPFINAINYYLTYPNIKFNGLGSDRFYDFNTPITALYMSDDYIANDKTADLMMEFFPNALSQLVKIDVKKYTNQKVGHVGIFRKRFADTLWPFLLGIIEERNNLEMGMII